MQTKRKGGEDTRKGIENKRRDGEDTRKGSGKHTKEAQQGITRRNHNKERQWKVNARSLTWKSSSL